MKIVQISDTHISHLGGATTENLERFIALVNSLEPALVVHSGDVAILDPDNADDRAAARRLLDGIQAPLRVLPGNHDVGEAAERPWADLEVTSERVAAFTDVFGIDRWVELVGEWAFVGLNTEILGSGLPEEADQWRWLETVPAVVGDRPTIVFGHKPVWNPFAGESEHNIAIPDAARVRLLETLAPVAVTAWASGHLHQYALATRPLGDGSTITVSCPATGFAHAEMAFLGTGMAQQGILEYELGEGDELGTLRTFFRAPLGLVEASPMAMPEFAVALQGLGVTL